MAAKCVKNGDVWGWGWSRPTCENSWVKLRAGEGGGGGLCPQCFEWVVGHCPNTILELQLLQRKKKEVKEEQRGNIRSNYGWSLTDQKADVKEAGLQLRLICLWQQIFPPSFSPPTAAAPPPTATAYIPTTFQSTNDGCSFHSYISQIENCRCSCISEIGNMKWQEVWGLCRPRLPATGRPVEPLDRHDICQNFYTSRFPKKMKFTSKMRVICDISDCWLLILNQAVTFILISTQMNIWILIFDNLNICHTQSWNYISEVEVFHFSNGNVFNGFVLIFRVHPLSLHF